MNLKHIALGFSLMMFGCGHQSPVFTIDERMTKDQWNLVHDSILYWNTVLIDPITIHDGPANTDDGHWRIILEEPDPGNNGQCDGSDAKNGWKRTIRISPTVQLDGMFHVAAHEIGHSVGMDHINPYVGIMNHSSNEIKFSDADMQMCRSYGLCWRDSSHP